MSEERTTVTDPQSYGHRDLLLLTQLLHTLGLLEPDQVYHSDKLLAISEKWYNHKGTVLLRRQKVFPLHKPPTAGQLATLYENMLADESCANTTELANKIYFARVQQLEEQIAADRATFKRILDEEP